MLIINSYGYCPKSVVIKPKRQLINVNYNNDSVSFSGIYTPSKLKTPLTKLLERFSVPEEKPILLVDKKDGSVYPARIDKPKNNAWYMICRGDCVGQAIFSIDYSHINGDNLPDYYRDRAYLFINSLSSHRTYKGIGTELVKALVKESYRRGLKGRVCLTTTTTNPEVGSPFLFIINWASKV